MFALGCTHGISCPVPALRRPLLFLLSSLAFFLLMPGLSMVDALSQDCIDYQEYLHEIGCYPTRFDRHVCDVAVSGSFAYAVVRFRDLRVLDISDPSNPVLKGTCACSGYQAAVLGSEVVINSGNGLRIVDAANPSCPIVVGTLVVPTFTDDLAVSDGHAFLAERDSGLVVVDLADPAAPAIVATYDALGQARGVAVRDGYAYVTADSHLHVLDATDPSNLQWIGSADLPGSAGAVDALGSLAVAIADSMLIVVDVSDPRAPQVRSTFACVARDVELYGTCACIAGGGYSSPNDLSVIDLSDPANPRLLARADPDDGLGQGLGLAASAGLAYVAVAGDEMPPDWNGLRVFSLGNLRAPQSVGRMPRSYDAIVVSGSCAFGAFGREVDAIDISDPEHPALMDRISVPGYLCDLAIEGSCAYGSTSLYEAGLQAIDITDPSDLRLAGSLLIPDYIHSVAVWAGFAYVTGDTGLYVVDIANPAEMAIVGGIAHPCRDVVVHDGLLYAAMLGGLRVIDITDPSSLWIMSGLDSIADTYHLAIRDHYAYVAGAALQIIDIQDHADLRLLGSVHPSASHNVALHSSCAYLSSEYAGLAVVDISNPEMPVLLGGAADFWPSGIAVSNTHLLAGDRVMPLQCASPASIVEHPLLSTHPIPGFGFRRAGLHLELPAAGRVRVTVHDVAGRLVRILIDDHRAVGKLDLEWDGRDDHGSPVGAGVYLIHSRAGGKVAAGRVVIIR